MRGKNEKKENRKNVMKQIQMENSSHTKGSILGSGLISVIHLRSPAIIKKTDVWVCVREGGM